MTPLIKSSFSSSLSSPSSVPFEAFLGEGSPAFKSLSNPLEESIARMRIYNKCPRGLLHTGSGDKPPCHEPIHHFAHPWRAVARREYISERRLLSIFFAAALNW